MEISLDSRDVTRLQRTTTFGFATERNTEIDKLDTGHLYALFSSRNSRSGLRDSPKHCSTSGGFSSIFPGCWASCDAEWRKIKHL